MGCDPGSESVKWLFLWFGYLAKVDGKKDGSGKQLNKVGRLLVQDVCISACLRSSSHCDDLSDKETEKRNLIHLEKYNVQCLHATNQYIKSLLVSCLRDHSQILYYFQTVSR